MRKIIITANIVILFYNICLAQTTIIKYDTADFDFIGAINEKPVFRYIYSSHDFKGELPKGFYQWGLYQLELINTRCNLKFYKERELESGRAFFVSDNIEIYWDYNEPTLLKVKTQETTFNFDHKKNIIQKPVFCELSKGNIAYSVYQENYYINIIELNKEISKTNLPLLGKKLLVKKDYLYFDYNHIDKSKSTPVPVDLYRVKIGDWNNPELLVEFISDGWLPLNDSIVLLTLPIKGRGQQVFYNVNQKTYAPVQGKLPTKEIQYEGKQYLLDNVKVGSERRYKLTEIPDVPKNGYIMDNTREILPLAFHANLPNNQKRFENTFVTEYLLYQASTAELQQLSKGQLRILRNAFFARQGYQFSSKDL